MTKRMAVVLVRPIQLKVARQSHVLPYGLVVRVLDLPDELAERTTPAPGDDARLMEAGTLAVGDVVA